MTTTDRKWEEIEARIRELLWRAENIGIVVLHLDDVRKLAALIREQREGETETQRAIIEAAEQRGYERGKAEWRQQVKDAWDNLSVEKVDKPKDTGRFA